MFGNVRLELLVRFALHCRLEARAAPAQVANAAHGLLRPRCKVECVDVASDAELSRAQYRVKTCDSVNVIKRRCTQRTEICDRQ